MPSNAPVTYRVICFDCGGEIYEGEDEWRARRFWQSAVKGDHDVRLQQTTIDWKDVVKP